MKRIVLKLYVAGRTPRTEQAVETVAMTASTCRNRMIDPPFIKIRALSVDKPAGGGRPGASRERLAPTAATGHRWNPLLPRIDR